MTAEAPAVAPKWVKILMLAAAVYQSRCRQRSIEAQLGIVQERMNKRKHNATCIMINLACMEQERKVRRVVPRCLGK